MSSSRSPALFLWAASRPNGRTSVRSAWTRMILRTPHKATGNSITRDPIVTGSGRGLDASQSVGETGGCAVLGSVSCRELFRIGRIGNLWYKFPRECARRAGKGRVRQFAHANRTLGGAAGMADENAGSERRSEILRIPAQRAGGASLPGFLRQPQSVSHGGDAPHGAGRRRARSHIFRRGSFADCRTDPTGSGGRGKPQSGGSSHERRTRLPSGRNALLA